MYVCLRTPGTGIRVSRALPPGCWELNPGPREEQPALLAAEPSLTTFKANLHVWPWIQSHVLHYT